MSWEIELVTLLTSVFDTHLARQALIDYTALGSYLLLPLYFIILYVLKQKKTAVNTVTTGIITGISVLTLKNIFMRPRPDVAIIEATGYSFPSGHAALGIALAVVLSDRWKKRKNLFYSLGILIALTRVLLGVHYPTDIIAGGILGYLVGKICVRYLPELYQRLRT